MAAYSLLVLTTPRSDSTPLRAVYPGSHRMLWPCLDDPINFVPNERYAEELQRIKDTVTPLELTGELGDTIFVHPRMVHSQGQHSAAGCVRLAAVCDFQRVRPRGGLWWQIDGAETPHGGGVGSVAPDGVVSFPPGVDVVSAGDSDAKIICKPR